ncbi:transducin beta-like protein 3 [Arapaima gigas]
MASSAVHFKSNYAVSSKIEPFYKGGKLQISKDEKYLFCTCTSRVNIVEIGTGKVFSSIEQEDQEDITCFAVSPDDEILVTASRALLLKHWNWKQSTCVRSWRAIHMTPVSSMTFDPTSTLLATGGSDSTIKIWDVLKQYCTHNLKGSSGVVHLVEFHPDPERLQLFSSSADCAIRVWDLRSSQCVCVLESHFSTVTSLAFSHDGNTLLSSGRDQICTVWDLKSSKAVRTVAVYETVEAVVLVPEGGDFQQIGVTSKGLHFITAGSKGVLRVWEASTSRCVFTQALSDPPAPQNKMGAEKEAEQLGLTYTLPLVNSARLAIVTAEHNILLYELPSLSVQQQFVGYNDEVLDVKFLGRTDSHIVVATNSPLLKVFELSTCSCQILYGHTDTVLAVDVFRKGHMFVSCAKDKMVLVWRMNPETGAVSCMAQGSGHANPVGSIACSRLKANFLVSGSQDCTIKVWELPENLPARGPDGKLEQFTARFTERAHDKDINSLAVSPNDKLLASGSQDRTAKLWLLADLSLLGVFRGHRRSIWCVQFSPMDQVLATSSADGTVKVWGLKDFSCLKTFEGHDTSVLKVIFVSRGTQLLTSGSDGLLKLWTIKTNECVKTLDAHQDKVWGLHANAKDNMVVTGSADSNIILWEDITEKELLEEQVKQEDQILKQQELSNLLHEGKYLKALGLAISLDQPHTVLRVIKEIRQGESGDCKLEETIVRLRQDQKESVLRYCVVWNTNARSCLDAHAVIQALLRHESPEDLIKYQGARGLLEGLLPYTERHVQRIDRLLQTSMFLDYLWQKMRVTGKSSGGLDGDKMETAPPQTEPLFFVDQQADQSMKGGEEGDLEDQEEDDEEDKGEEGIEGDSVEGGSSDEKDGAAHKTNAQQTKSRDGSPGSSSSSEESEEEEVPNRRATSSRERRTSKMGQRVTTLRVTQVLAR